MSSIALFKNNATSTLAGAITNTSLTANLASGAGALFPAPGAGQYFALTFTDAATGLLNEIVSVTNVTGDTITMVRGQEGTAAQAWNAGDLAQQLVTAGDLQTFAQTPQVQTGSTNTATDTGVANAYVVNLNPALTNHLVGAPIWWKAANNNTGASTFSDGAGTLPLINPDGTALGSGTIVAGGYYGSLADGSGHFQLISVSNEALSSQGIATTGDMKFRPTNESIPGWVVANGLTLGNATSGATGLASAATLALFTWLWTNFSNTQCPVVPSGRGGSAAADFAANKTIQLLAWQGMTPVGVDTMGGAATNFLSGVTVVSGSSSTPGSILGANTITLSAAQMPSITSAGSNNIGATGSNTVVVNSTVTNVDLGISGTTTGGGGSPVNSVTAAGSLQSAGQPTITVAGTNTISVTSNNTGGSVTPIVSRSMGVYWYLKL